MGGSALELAVLDQSLVEAVVGVLVSQLQGILNHHLRKIAQRLWHAAHRVACFGSHFLHILAIEFESVSCDTNSNKFPRRRREDEKA